MAEPPRTMEQHLRDRFEVRVERFAHRELSLEILLPRSPEALIDESEFNVDERLPYWADLWPSARALTRHLLEHPLPAGRVVELGSGVALPSLALLAHGVEVVATDYYPEALEFARANAERNGLSPLATALVDWRNPPPDLGVFSLVLAADVLYERRNVDALSALLPQLLGPGGTVLLADPGRVYLEEFRARMETSGWTLHLLAEREETSAAGEHLQTRVRLLQLSPGTGAHRFPKL